MRQTFLYILSLVFCVQAVSAQDSNENLPDSLRFTIKKDYRPVARDARKILPQPKVQHDSSQLKKVDYTVIPKTKEVSYEAEPLQAAKLSNEPLPKLYNGFVKAGFGNYTMPFFEASFASLRSKKYQAGFFARYHASFAKLNKVRDFGFTDAGIQGFGKYFMKNHLLKGILEYDVDENYYYGWDVSDVRENTLGAVSDDSLHQVFHHVGLNLDLTAYHGKKLHIIDQANLAYSYTRGNFQEQEHYAALSGGVAFKIKKEKMFIRTSFDYWNLSQPSFSTNNLVWGIQPKFRAERKRWAIDLGVDFTLDVNDSTTKVLVFPILDFHYFLVKDMLRFYIGAKGGVTRNGLRTISEVNPYFHTNQELSNTWERLNVYAGFKGSIIKGLGFDLSVAEIINGQQMFFVNDTARGLGHRFLTEYHDTRITRFAGALSYQLKSKLALFVEAEYRLFAMPNDSIKPWHEAPFRLTFAGNYNLKDKFIFKAAITAFGPRVAPEFGRNEFGNTTLSTTTLKGYADASLGVEYRYRKWLGAFVDFRNIAALRYEVWNQYQAQRFSFIAGLHFSF